jgi:GDPmannose 4,6-dehydratase
VKALITGITGQDGSYLAELLLGKGYQVHGIIRRSSSFNTQRIDHIIDKLTLHHGDLCDGGALTNLLWQVEPDEIYHLGAQSHVRVSFDLPAYTADTIVMGTTRLLEAYRLACPKARYYQASSSEMFGASPPPQHELTPFMPRSPYGCSKVFAYHMAVNYRDGFSLPISNGILFNHESPRRGETFVSRKIAKAVARIKAGKQQDLTLGNLEARRDWGYAPDYVNAMWLMLRHHEPGDYVIATGESHSVRKMCEEAFTVADLDWREYVKTDERYFRPTEVDHLRGDAGKAERVLGWAPSVTFSELVRLMVKAETDGL